MSKQLDKTGFGANKEKAGKGKEFEKVDTLGEKIREERKPPDETVFKTVFEGSEVEEIGKDKDGEIKSKGVTEAYVTKATGHKIMPIADCIGRSDWTGRPDWQFD